MNVPEGYAMRAGSRRDVDIVLRLVEVAEEHYDGAVEVDRSDVVMDFDRVGYDPATDLVVVERGGEPVAWASVHQDRAECDVHPHHQGRGVGTAILRWTEDRARERGTMTVHQTVTDGNADAPALFAAHGYEPSRTSWVLEIAFDGPPPEQPTPEGIEIHPYDAADAERVYRVIEDAFGEWPGRTSLSFEEWSVYVPRHEAFSPGTSRVAFDGDDVVGATLAFDYAGVDEGWIQQVATAATHRHRGIARALLHETFRAFHALGKERCGLSTDSRTGALSLYERVEMRVRRSYTTYERSLDAG